MKIPKFRELPWIKEIVDYRETKQAFGENFGEALRAQPELRKARLKCRDGVMKIVAVPVILASVSLLIMKIAESNFEEKPVEPIIFNRSTPNIVIPDQQNTKVKVDYSNPKLRDKLLHNFGLHKLLRRIRAKKSVE